MKPSRLQGARQGTGRRPPAVRHDRGMWRRFILLVVACAFIVQGTAAAASSVAVAMPAGPGALAGPARMPCHETVAMASHDGAPAPASHPATGRACTACHACCAAALWAGAVPLSPISLLRYRLASAEAVVDVTFLTSGPLRPPRSTAV